MTDLGLDAATLRGLADGWNDGGLWDDILWLALTTWDADAPAERAVSWNHLVMAVGNFKRQRGRRLFPTSLTPVTNLRFAPRAGVFEVPGTGHLLLAEDTDAQRAVDSWAGLELRGAGPPTRTTLLAALWPESHHILDWRVLAAASALTLGTDRDLRLVPKNGTRSLQPKLEHYPPVRALLLDVAAETRVPLSTVERALYILTTAVPSRGGRTWLGYRDALLRAASRPVKARAEDDGSMDPEGQRPAAP